MFYLCTILRVLMYIFYSFEFIYIQILRFNFMVVYVCSKLMSYICWSALFLLQIIEFHMRLYELINCVASLFSSINKLHISIILSAILTQ